MDSEDSKQLAWDLFFASIASLRFHPRNEVKDADEEVKYAAKIADLMMKERERRCQ